MSKDATIDRRTFLEIGAATASLALGVSALGCDSDDGDAGTDVVDQAMDQGDDTGVDTPGDTGDDATPDAPPRDMGVDVAEDMTEPDLGPSTFSFALGDHPVLDAVGGLVAFEGDETGFRDRVFVYHDEAEGLIAVSSKCTHRGCEIDAFSSAFECPCHGSQFEFDGALRLGPAERDLDRFQLELDGDTATITEVTV